MSSKIKFHLDEHIKPAIAQGLRRQGIDITTTVEAQLRTTSDQVQNWITQNRKFRLS